MNTIDKYIEKLKEEIKEKNLTEEIEIIKYIYINFGKIMSFDEKFIPFGNSKNKQKMYSNCSEIKNLDECMNKNTAICKSLSKILEYILKAFDVNITTVTDPLDKRKCPHVFNLIKMKDGRKFCVDIQEDINNIQTHSFTSNFGLETIYSSNLKIDRKEQEKIDRKIGYIADNNYYADNYLYLLHWIADSMDNFLEKVDFILENIDINSTVEMGYTDRQWHHKKILEEFFDKKEFDYQTDSGKIKTVDLYKDINGERKYINCITVRDNNETHIYIYNVIKNKYCKISLKNFANSVEKGLVIHNSNVPGLGKELYNRKYK